MRPASASGTATPPRCELPCAVPAHATRGCPPAHAPRSDYPEWSKTIDDINAAGKINHGEWTPYKGPPFMERMVLYSGNDVDVTTVRCGPSSSRAHPRPPPSPATARIHARLPPHPLPSAHYRGVAASRSLPRRRTFVRPPTFPPTPAAHAHMCNAVSHIGEQAGNLVRMVMGLKKNFGKWEGNGYLKNFETQQMRFVQSNKVSFYLNPKT